MKPLGTAAAHPPPPRNLLLLAGGAAACLDLPALVRSVHADGWRASVVRTPAAHPFLGDAAVAALSLVPPLDPESLGTANGQPQAVIWAPITPVDLATETGKNWLRALGAANLPLVVCAENETHTETLRRAFSQAGVSVSAWCACIPGTAACLPVLPLEQLGECLAAACETQDFSGIRVLVTAGPTVEDLDPVRFISNRSSGRMGVALVRAAARRGAAVTVVHGPLRVPLPPLPTVRGVAVRSAAEMHTAVMGLLDEVDVAIFCAAVADFTPAAKAAAKIKKSGQQSMTLELVRTADILAAAGARSPRPFLVGFAAESSDLDRYAQEKLRGKNCDLLCANDISQEGSGFEVDTNRICIYRRHGHPICLPHLSKLAAAQRILNQVLRLRREDA